VKFWFGRAERQRLARIERVLDELLRKEHKIMSQLSDLITALNDNTNLVAAKLDKLAAELAAAGTAPTPEQLAQLQGISDHLKALGSDPANPVPAPAPEPTPST